ncbi:PH domain-containing protein [Patescibacteria group bacterium]|nr:PH domain-containing protein [Patescibacteria group bacterium]
MVGELSPSNKSISSQTKGEPHHLPMPESMLHERPTHNPLSSYMVKPKVHFETQDREEKIILLLRRHVITNIGWVLTALFLFVVPAFWSFVPLVGFFPTRFQIVIIVMWYLLVTAYIFEHFLSWYYNVHIITDERIVDVDFHSLLYKEVSDMKIDNIQDVTFVMGGALRSLLNYGTVYIQTAGQRREFDFDDVPRPDRVAKVLNELIIEEEQEKIEGRVR